MSFVDKLRMVFNHTLIILNSLEHTVNKQLRRRERERKLHSRKKWKREIVREMNRSEIGLRISKQH